MTQRELNRAVAVLTGESLREVRRHGFSLANPWETDFDSEPNEIPPQMVDWDETDAQRQADLRSYRSSHVPPRHTTAR